MGADDLAALASSGQISFFIAMAGTAAFAVSAVLSVVNDRAQAGGEETRGPPVGRANGRPLIRPTR